MEDPIRFDISARIQHGHQSEAERDLAKSLQISRLDLLKQIYRSTHGESMIIANGVSWSEIENFRQNVPDWVMDYSVYQEGYSPKLSPSYCKIHDFWYGGCLGCHVCRNFYKKR